MKQTGFLFLPQLLKLKLVIATVGLIHYRQQQQLPKVINRKQP